MKPITLLHITSSLKRGGAETFLVSLIQHLPTGKYQHHVIYFHDGPLRTELEKLGIAVYTPSHYCIRYDPFFMFELSKIIKKINPDAIHALLWASSLYARFFSYYMRIPVFCSLHALPTHEGFFRTLCNRYAPQPTTYCAVSPSIEHAYKAAGLAKSPIITIPNGIQLPRSQPAHHDSIHSSLPTACFDKLNMSGDKHRSSQPARRSLLLRSSNFEEQVWRRPGVNFRRKLVSRDGWYRGSEKDTFTIGAVGRFVPVKNFSLLMYSFKSIYEKFSHVRLVIIGHGPLENNLRTLADTLEISPAVTFIINKPALDYYSQFDCFVQPSHYEGMSLALLEALAHKLPVIVTGKNKVHDVITHSINGLVIEPGNQEELTQALEFYIHNSQIRFQHAQNGLHTAGTHSLERMITAYDKLFCGTQLICIHVLLLNYILV